MTYKTAKENMISISATNGTRFRHVGVYTDKVTADRVKADIEYYAGKGWKLWEK